VKIIVIGAGPAGLTTATLLARSGVEVTVYEASDAIGGLSRSLQLWGQTVDLGPHRFFSRDRRVNNFWLEILGRDYRMVKRLTRIYYKDRFFNYPLHLTNVIANLGVNASARTLLSYLYQLFIWKQQKDETFESWVTGRFGKHLYEEFFKSYSEKLWGLPCAHIDADFAKQRIRSLSLYEALKSLARFTRSKSNPKHRSLLDEFAYPRGGTGSLYLKMADDLKRHNGRILTGCPITQIQIMNGRAVGVIDAAGNLHESDGVVSTMPLTHLIAAISDVPAAVKKAAEQLKFRNTVLVYLQLSGSNPFPDNWLYINSPELKVGRITNFRNWVPDLYREHPETIICLEYWCGPGDKFWNQPDEDIIELAKKELGAINLFSDNCFLDSLVVRVPRSYPVYEVGYKQHVEIIKEYLVRFAGLQAIGRYGSFKYNNQDHSILMGILAAENILSGNNHELWEVNSDYETYNETGYISETGLV